MIFSVKVYPADYEEVELLLINADTVETALYLAKKEIEEHDMFKITESNFDVEEVDLKNNKILATVINW